MQKQKTVLADLSFSLMGYEDGDIVALSGLADLSQKLAALLAKMPAVAALAEKIAALCKQALQGKIDSLPVGPISAAIDLIQRWASEHENGQGASESLLSEIEHWNAEDSATDSGASAAELATMAEPLAIFLSEAKERLSDAQGLVLELENDLSNKTTVDLLFRTFHTIKGECGFLKIHALGELAHNIENLLHKLRSQELDNDEEIIDILLAGIDGAQAQLSALRRGEQNLESAFDSQTYLGRLQLKTNAGQKRIGDLLQDSGKLSASDIDAIVETQKSSNFAKKFGEIALERDLVSPAEVEELIREQKSGAGVLGNNVASDPLIKVKASQINYLVDMIGELLIIENQLDDREKNIVALKKISRSIQGAAMQLRTVKVKNLFINLKRLTRDAAKQLGKTVSIETRGEDLEIDRNLVELLEEPLMHLVRNCVGHGIESPQQRSASGKPEQGEVLVSALRQGNSIVISVRDDGGGLDAPKILDKAIAKGLVPESRRHLITQSEIFNLIFLPGFSTAEQVNAISGRGVGMDIVKSTVSAARGRVEIKSEAGLYSEFSLIFPLSLAIIDGMIVVSAGTHYILPIANIIETMKIEPAQLQSIEGRSTVLDIRHEILPVICMAEYFAPSTNRPRGNFAIIVENEDKKYAVLVDAIVAKKEVVIKSLGKKFRQLVAISSAAVLPGGSIGFVVNVEELVKI